MRSIYKMAYYKDKTTIIHVHTNNQERNVTQEVSESLTYARRTVSYIIKRNEEKTGKPSRQERHNLIKVNRLATTWKRTTRVQN